MTSRFGKYLGYMSVNVDGDMIEITPTLRQKEQLLGIQMKSKGELSSEDWNAYHKIFKEILLTSDNSATVAELDAFLLKHDITFMLELFKGFGWISSSEVVNIKKSLTGKVIEKNQGT